MKEKNQYHRYFDCLVNKFILLLYLMISGKMYILGGKYYILNDKNLKNRLFNHFSL